MSKASQDQEVHVETAKVTKGSGHPWQIEFRVSFASDCYTTPHVSLFTWSDRARACTSLTADDARELAAGLIRAAEMCDARQ